MPAEDLKRELAEIAREEALQEIVQERMPNIGEEYSVISERVLASLKADESIVAGIILDVTSSNESAE